MDEYLKKCTKCCEDKEINDFYMCAGKYRSECKRCTIKRNSKYQIKNQTWKHRFEDEDARKAYMQKYYSKNREKFAMYRAEFKARNPDYYKNYTKRRKQKQHVRV